MVVVVSAESFNSILSKVQDEKLPAVFYYTMPWCGPCRVIAPFVSRMSSHYPKVPVYEVDTELEGLGNKLHDLLVPMFHFYHKGQKIGEIVGADPRKVEAVMESLYTPADEQVVGFHGCYSKRCEKEEEATDAFIESTLDRSSDELKSEVSNTKQIGFKPTNVKDVIIVVQFVVIAILIGYIVM